MKKLLTILLLLVAISTSALASVEGDEMDSLIRVAFSGRFDTASAGAFEKLTTFYWSANRDSTGKYLHILRKQLVEFREHTNEPMVIMRMELSLALLLKLRNSVAECIQHLYTALALADELGDVTYQAFVSQEIGLSYYMQANWNKAMYHFKLSSKYFGELGEHRRVLTQEYLTGLSLNNASRYAEALPILRNVYRESIANNSMNRILESGVGYAAALRGTNDLDSAEALYRHLMTQALSEEFYNSVRWSSMYSGLALVLFGKGQLDSAEFYALKTLSLSRRFDYFFPRLEALQTLYKVYKAQGNFKQAYHYLEMYTHDHDSLQNEETTVQLGVAQAVFEHEKRESSILSEEARKRQVMWFAIGLFGVLTVVVGYFYRSISKQKKTSELLLANILPRETIAELKKDGVVTPRIHQDVSIMFCDVKDFTSIAEALSPQALVNILDDHIRLLDEIVSSRGLEKIKTIGDAYMAAGGLHDQSTNYAYRMGAVAIEILRSVESANTEMLKKYGCAFSYRIGIHTGSVVSGMVGRDKYAYDVWGDTVNVASRMESSGAPGRVHVSEAFFVAATIASPTNNKNPLPSAFTFVKRGTIDVKGKGIMKTYWLEEETT